MIDERALDNLNRVALAVSGGKDSMALLHDVAKRYPCDFFYVVNVEHGIRGEESRADSDFVAEYARSLGVEVVRYDVDAVGYSREHGYTLEQGARLLRREIFEREVREGRADRVAVAHHMDDNVESVLMHIFRGSGLRGLRGMALDDGLLVRPLIGVTRREIDEYITANDIPFREDSTNADSSYRRNYIRHEIMPLLRDRYPAIDESVMRLSRSASEDDEYLYELSTAYVKADGDRMLVDIRAPRVLLKRALYSAFIALGVTADIEERHYALLIDLAEAENGTSLDMPYGIVATLEYGYIALYRQRDMDDSACIIELGDNVLGDYVVNVAEVTAMDRDTACGGERVLYADGDSIDGATLRHRETGDVFKRYRGGKKKLKDYFIDIKLPRSRRDIPLIVRDSEVLVVAGIEISDAVAIDDNTTKIYKITLRRNAK